MNILIAWSPFRVKLLNLHIILFCVIIYYFTFLCELIYCVFPLQVAKGINMIFFIIYFRRNDKFSVVDAESVLWLDHERFASC